MSAQKSTGKGDVIDASTWLAERVELLIRMQRFEEAIGYLQMLLSGVNSDDERQECATYLGYLYLLVDDLESSAQWLREAQTLAPHDPHLSYALGHVAMGRRRPSLGMLYFLEAFAEAEADHDEAEFLRSGAVAMMQVVGPTAQVAAMLLGALDRDLGNPWILDALARVYAADERWLESLETLAALAEVVRKAARSVVLYRVPAARHLLRNRLMGRSAQPEELQRRAREINEAVRRQFEIVLDARQRRGPTGLTALRFPPALSCLVGLLERRDRGVELIETAQNLWARAAEARFDEILGSARLAAAIHVLVERLHWRKATPLSEVATQYGATPDSISAAARVVAGRLGVKLFDETMWVGAVDLPQRRRVEEVSRALLFGEALEQARSGSMRLGG